MNHDSLSKNFLDVQNVMGSNTIMLPGFLVFPYGIDVQLSSRALDENYRCNTWTVELFLCWAGEKQVYQEDLR